MVELNPAAVIPVLICVLLLCSVFNSLALGKNQLPLGKLP